VPDGLTNADLVMLGLLAEEPRHAYDLEVVIRERGIREWTSLAFSSVYFVLNRLEERGLVRSERAAGGPKARRVYRLTEDGRSACVEGTRRLLVQLPHRPAPVLVGMANSALLPADEFVAALQERRRVVTDKLAELRRTRSGQEPVPRSAAAIFSYHEAELGAELSWISEVLADAPGSPEED
jgi:DNA-binding PadR family transcriptional regulator